MFKLKPEESDEAGIWSIRVGLRVFKASHSRLQFWGAIFVMLSIGLIRKEITFEEKWDYP